MPNLIPLLAVCFLSTVLTRLGTTSPLSVSVLSFALTQSPALAISAYLSSLLALTHLELQEQTTNPELLYLADSDVQDASYGLKPRDLLLIKCFILVFGLMTAWYWPSIPFRLPAIVALPVISYFILTSWGTNESYEGNQSWALFQRALAIGIPVAIVMRALAFFQPSFNPAIALLIALSASSLLTKPRDYYSPPAYAVEDGFHAVWNFVVTVGVSLVTPGVGVSISSAMISPYSSQVSLGIANLAIEAYTLGSCLFGNGSSKTMLGAALQTNWMPNPSPEFLNLLPFIIVGAIGMNYLLVAAPLTPKRSQAFQWIASAMLVVQGVLGMGPYVLVFIIAGVALNRLIPIGLRPLLILLVAV